MPPKDCGEDGTRSPRERLMMVRAYSAIRDPIMRRRLLQLAQAIADQDASGPGVGSS